eukprot:12155804-Alexandrium_andersonii.AAC.1
MRISLKALAAWRLKAAKRRIQHAREGMESKAADYNRNVAVRGDDVIGATQLSRLARGRGGRR